MKRFIATVHIVLDEAIDTVDGACDALSGLLTGDSCVLDWRYAKNPDGSFQKPKETEWNERQDWANHI